ncbi:polar amino acid transport system permease [Enterococcus sp. DIV0876]
MMDLSFLTTYYPYFISGVLITIVISIITVILGTILGVLLALMKLSKITVFRWFANAYIEIIRGTPMLVQILIAFGLLQGVFSLPTVSFGVLSLDFGRLLPGVIALSLNSGAYVAEIVRAGINAVDLGQSEAAGSLGLRPAQAMRYVIFPQALRNILPPLGNEFIVLIKDSSLLSTIGIYELMNSAQIVVTSSFQPLTPFYVAAVIYFILTFTTSRLLNLWEKKLGKGYRR